jgi:hypothetical protein
LERDGRPSVIDLAKGCGNADRATLGLPSLERPCRIHRVEPSIAIFVVGV